MISFFPEISTCSMCPVECESCLHSFCLTCADSYLENSSFEINLFPGMVFQDCKKPAVVCAENCSFCDPQGNCLCLIKPFYSFSSYNSEFGTCQREKCLSCEDCEGFCDFQNNIIENQVNSVSITSTAVQSKTCKPGFHLQGSLCLKCPTNCLECVFKSGEVKCLQCNIPSVLTSPCVSLNESFQIRFSKFLNPNSSVSLSSLSDLKNSTLYNNICLLYTSPSPRDLSTSRMPSSA